MEEKERGIKITNIEKEAKEIVVKFTAISYGIDPKNLTWDEIPQNKIHFGKNPAIEALEMKKECLELMIGQIISIDYRPLMKESLKCQNLIDVIREL